jgi:hypothetical protein
VSVSGETVPSSVRRHIRPGKPEDWALTGQNKTKTDSTLFLTRSLNDNNSILVLSTYSARILCKPGVNIGASLLDSLYTILTSLRGNHLSRWIPSA